MSTDAAATQASMQRSTFVTAVAWIFIVLSGFATPIAVLQNVMFFTVFRRTWANAAMARPDAAANLPPVFLFMFENMHLFVLGFLVAGVATLVASVGLLRRKNWARVLFIVLMALGITEQIGASLLQLGFMTGLLGVPSRASEMKTTVVTMQVFTGVLAISLSALFGWIIKRLASPDVRQEFVS